MDLQPWHELPAEVADVLRPVLSEAAEQMIDAVRAVPVYSRPLEGGFGEGLRAGVQEALRHLLAEIEAGAPVPRRDVYRMLGRGEMRAGRSLEALLSAYRIGARVAWRRFAAAGAAADLAPETMYLLAESIFAYIDVLSAESAEGHALEQSAVAGEAERRRRRLVRLLVSDPPVDPERVQAAAAEVSWSLPRTLAALAIAGEGRELATVRLPHDAISETIGELGCVIIPDPDGPGRRGEVSRAVHEAGMAAGLGTTVSWRQAPLSFARARSALALAAEAPALVVASERAGELLLASEPRLAREIALERLAPLRALRASSRARFAETLR
ncbi:MAG: PucR family transcriptional regulator, partial [Actinomycetota bacterium]|nr:PucR family transcriptional regulator [Actinomycetota bacterium]